MKLQVQEHAHLIRDTESNAILNVDNRALHAYKKRKQHMNKIQDLESSNDELRQQVKGLEDKMDQILTLLQQTINSK